METLEAIASFTLMIGIILLLLCLYFLPTIVADRRKHHNATAIFLFNLFLGFTFLGWVLALVWATTNPAPTPAAPERTLRSLWPPQ